ncbi:MAG: right-handed parallel beta-helix repeat-containing protein, partial [Deltaproteobacteria bacterium]|nr:right-handed parallel beta-helix repeat-containing protein [Candidatus Zymogenaceae bacterium]
GNVVSKNALEEISIEESEGTVFKKNVVIDAKLTASPKEGGKSTVVKFTIVITNTGQVDLEDISVADQLPVGFDYVSDNRSGHMEGSMISWTLPGTLAPDESEIIELSLSMNGAAFGNLTNRVKATGETLEGVVVSDEASEVVVAFIVVGPGESISKVIEQARPGDAVAVQSGTYSENIVLDKSIILKGMDTGGGPPILVGDGVGSTLTLTADGCTVERFEVTGSGNPHAGIEIVSNDNSISYNVIKNNRGYGVLISRASGNAVVSNEIRGNGFDGVHLEESNRNDISTNTLKGNSGSGMKLVSSSNNIISGNTATGNGGVGIHLTKTSDGNTISGNTATGNFRG